MTVQINSNYLEKYAKDYAAKVCDKFFSSRQFMTGQDIVQLTNSTQVNFFVIKRLFELWQDELGKLKSNPFFDYRDVAVHEALTQFMNVLSRRIKVERSHLQPLLESAVVQAIVLATDPVGYYQSEVSKAPSGKVNEYLRENRKYYKWHDKAVTFLIDKAGFGHDDSAYTRAISANYQVIKDSLESVNLLLATFGDILPFNLDVYLEKSVDDVKPTERIEVSETKASFFEQIEEKPIPVVKEVSEPEAVEKEQIQVVVETPPMRSTGTSGKLDAKALKSKFATESYKGMKGAIGELSESLAINQRFMFTKELFDGNADLLRHALKSIDSSHSFDEAINLVNTRYVEELGWDTNSEEVHEFLQLIYRRFAD